MKYFSLKRTKKEKAAILFFLVGGAAFFGVGVVFAYGQLIVGIAVVEHALGYGSGGMFAVCEDADFRGSFDEGAVECGPRAACERYDAHIVIRHHQSVGK